MLNNEGMACSIGIGQKDKSLNNYPGWGRLDEHVPHSLAIDGDEFNE